MNKKLLSQTFITSTTAVIYVFGVSLIMNNGEKLFANNELFAPLAVLLLFCISAAVTASLVFGRSVLLFFDGKKKESMLAGVYSVSWLAIYFAVIIAYLFFS